MYKYFKNISDKSACLFSGVCSVHPTISALYEAMLSEIREASFYIVKLKEFGFTNINAMSELIEALSIFMINTNISEKGYLDLINKLHDFKKEAKEKYTSYCKNNELNYEVIYTGFEINKDTTINSIIKQAELNSKRAQKACDKSKADLFELIILFAKLASINVAKIKKYEPDFNNYDYEILRFFALTNGYAIRNEKIKRRILEFQNTFVALRKKLNDILSKRYGEKQSAKIATGEQVGKSILVSGDDLYELEKIITTLDSMKLKEKINIYTHGGMFIAHFYPFFKNSGYLKGHWGTSDAHYDFSTFKGSILITKNFIQKIDNIYKGNLFSNTIIPFSKISSIKNDDFTPLIESALNSESFLETKNKKSYFISYDKDKAYKTGSCEEVIIIINKGKLELDEQYKDKKVISFDCPLENELIFETIKKLKEKRVKTTVFNSYCNIESLSLILSLLSSDVELYIANCSNILINPHSTEALKNNFGIKLV